MFADNIAYYKCDISKPDEVEEVANKVKEDVSRLYYAIALIDCIVTDRTSYHHNQQRRRRSRKINIGFDI
jgi:hypothetical protein